MQALHPTEARTRSQTPELGSHDAPKEETEADLKRVRNQPIPVDPASPKTHET
jgi:hypothetical protein